MGGKKRAEQFFEAVQDGNTHRVQSLLYKVGTNVHNGHFRKTALHMAADTYFPHMDIVRLLLDAAADPNVA